MKCPKAPQDDLVNCTGWIGDFSDKSVNVMSHPCYTWTFIEAFW